MDSASPHKSQQSQLREMSGPKREGSPWYIKMMKELDDGRGVRRMMLPNPKNPREKEPYNVTRIGKGRYGHVFMVESEQGTPVAVKVQEDDEEARREIDVMKRVSGKPHSPILLGSIVQNGLASFSVPVAVGDAKKVLGKYRENPKIVKCLAMQCLLSVRFFHRHEPFLHCDFHLGNFLVYPSPPNSGVTLYKRRSDAARFVVENMFHVVAYDFNLVQSCSNKTFAYDYFRCLSPFAGILRFQNIEYENRFLSMFARACMEMSGTRNVEDFIEVVNGQYPFVTDFSDLVHELRKRTFADWDIGKLFRKVEGRSAATTFLNVVSKTDANVMSVRTTKRPVKTFVV